jgi:uncharacterized protein (TIGR03545 family)
MFCWKVFQIRLVILLLLIVCLWTSARSLTKPVMGRILAATFGSSVEFAHCEISLSKKEVSFSQLQIADPIDPMRNLIRARRMTAVVEPAGIWNRRLNIARVTANDILLASPRERLAGDRLNGAPDNWNRTITKTKGNSIESASKRWLDQIQSQPPLHASALSELSKAIERLQNQWSIQFEKHFGECQKIQSGLEAVKAELSRPRSNPLRETAQRQKWIADFNRLQAELSAKQDWIEHWSQFQAVDLEKLKMIKDSVYRQVESRHFDQATIAESKGLLVCEKNVEIAAQLTDWTATALQRLSLLNESSIRSATRGRNVIFRGSQASPAVSIRQLDFQGAVHFAGRHIDFIGGCRNLTDQPQLSDDPLEFWLRGQGHDDNLFTVNGTLDRRQSIPHDLLQFSFPASDIENQSLGTPGSLLVKLSPHRWQTEAEVHIDGDEIRGTLVTYHSNVGMYVAALNDIAGGSEIQTKLNQQLSTFNQFQVTTRVSGSLEKPTFEFESDLAERFASVHSMAIAEFQQDQAARDQTRIEEMYHKSVYELNEFADERLAMLRGLCSEQTTRVTELERAVPDAALRTNR